MKNLYVRLATDKDYPEILNCLENLSSCEYDKYKFINALKSRTRRDVFTFVAVWESKIVGTASLIIETKLSHGNRKCAHIEDVAVLKGFEKNGVGKALIKHIMIYCEQFDCYKVILDCDETVSGFYEKFGFKPNGMCMRIDL